VYDSSEFRVAIPVKAVISCMYRNRTATTLRGNFLSSRWQSPGLTRYKCWYMDAFMVIRETSQVFDTNLQHMRTAARVYFLPLNLVESARGTLAVHLKAIYKPMSNTLTSKCAKQENLAMG